MAAGFPEAEFPGAGCRGEAHLLRVDSQVGERRAAVLAPGREAAGHRVSTRLFARAR